MEKTYGRIGRGGTATGLRGAGEVVGIAFVGRVGVGSELNEERGDKLGEELESG